MVAIQHHQSKLAGIEPLRFEPFCEIFVVWCHLKARNCQKAKKLENKDLITGMYRFTG
jgi:hypothetical protein